MDDKNNLGLTVVAVNDGQVTKLHQLIKAMKTDPSLANIRNNPAHTLRLQRLELLVESIRKP